MKPSVTVQFSCLSVKCMSYTSEWTLNSDRVTAESYTGPMLEARVACIQAIAQ